MIKYIIYLVMYIWKCINVLLNIREKTQKKPRVLSPFRGGEIAYLNDPDNYAGWSFYTPVKATKARQVEG